MKRNNKPKASKNQSFLLYTQTRVLIKIIELGAVGIVGFGTGPPLFQEFQGCLRREASATYEISGHHGDAAVHPQATMNQDISALLIQAGYMTDHDR